MTKQQHNHNNLELYRPRSAFNLEVSELFQPLFGVSLMTTKTKKSDDQLAQELGLVEERHEPECSSHLQKLLNRKSRSKTQAYADWMSLVEAQVAKEFIPQDLIQQTYDEINENERYYDGYTALVNDARDLQAYRRGLRHKKLNQKENFIKNLSQQ